MVTRLGEAAILAVTTKDFPPKTYAEFIAYAKANPGKVRYASVGIGSNNHYDTEAFAKWAGIQLVHIPNKGGGERLLPTTWSLATRRSHRRRCNFCRVMRAGQLCLLAVMSDRRVPEYDVPTTVELGYANGKGSRSCSCAERDAARRARDHPQSHRPGAELRTGHTARISAADDQGGAELIDRGRQGLDELRLRTGRRSPKT